MVTAVYNGEKYLEDTIRSILYQNYPNLEYFIVDGGSTDGTVEVIRKYEKEISGWISEPDRGMYHALNKGFARTSGEIMGWLNCSDKLHTGGLAVVGSVFRKLPEVEWITGLPSGFTEEGMTSVVELPRRWSRYRFLAGANRYIMQETTFWRRGLWQKAGGFLDDSGRCGVVADFELWVRFFRHARLYPVHALIGGYRNHPDSLALQRLDECHRIQEDVIDTEITSLPNGRGLRRFRQLREWMKKLRGFRDLWWHLVDRPLNTWHAADWPPIIVYNAQQGGWVFIDEIE
jgi:glycosyltransferase involved in cell wall biosynthesis